LHGHDFLLNLAENEVSLTRFKITFHVYLLSQLS
jgi:hypothetical protein